MWIASTEQTAFLCACTATAMKILITGASGFIGGRLRSALQGRGHLLRLAGRRPPSDLAAGEEWIALDLSRPA